MSDTDPLAPFGLAGKTAIVTGAASGIGRATATLFAQVGARVLFVDLDDHGVRAAAAAVGMSHAVCDISEETKVQALFAAAQELLGGRLDVLANVAAYRRKADTMSMSASEWDLMHAVTARGTFLMMREAIRVMRPHGGGSIVNVSSVSAQHPTIFANMHYDAAKAGVDAMTRAAAVEFAGHGIRVNSVRPGGTASGGAARMADERPPTGPMTGTGRIPLGRLSDPIEQARAILFLASDASSYITGHHLTVDGGYHVS